jgi:predicted component of type VI protein secretion system
MKDDTIHALFSEQNEILCNSILSNLDAWLTTKFSNAMHRLAFRKESDVRIFISTVEQRKTQDQVKFNSYVSRIAKRLCYDNPNKATETFDTAPAGYHKIRINITYDDVAATTTIS